MNILTLAFVGLVAGWLAGQVMKGGGYGILADVALGVLGGVVGGWLLRASVVWPGGGILAAIAVSAVGAVVLVGLARLIKSI